MASEDTTATSGQVPVQPGTPRETTVRNDGSYDSAIQAELEAMGALEDDPDAQDQPQEGQDEQELEPNPDNAAEEGADAPSIELAEGEVEYTTESGRKYAIPEEVAHNMLRQRDYTQNMQQLGEYARQQQAREQQIDTLFEVGQHLSVHKARLSQIDAAERAIRDELTKFPNMAQEDGPEFSRLTGLLTLCNMERQTTQQTLEQASAAHSQYQAQQTAQRVARVMPELNKMGFGPQHMKAVESHFISMGATPEVMRALNEARFPGAIVMAAESLMYRNLMQQKATATTKVNTARSTGVLRPGHSATGMKQGSNVSRAQQRLSSTGSTKDAVALELAHMGAQVRSRNGRFR